MAMRGDGRVAKCINTLARFCGARDIATLTGEALFAARRIGRADVMALFGGSILRGGDVLAKAMRNGVADTYVIVGGAGHTTEALRVQMERECPGFEAKGLPEAEIFAAYLKIRYGLEPDFLECGSTNCGNNITNLLKLLRANRIPLRNIILSQDATMQRRMEAGLRKHAPDGVGIINYATYAVKVREGRDGLAFEEDLPGMWDMDRYLTLLMGEIPRLLDDVDGYGPRGKGYIAHVDIPADVMDAFLYLKRVFGDKTREADPRYSSR